MIVESSSSMPSTPDAPDCGSRSREMYNVAMVLTGFFDILHDFFIKRAPKRSFVYVC